MNRRTFLGTLAAVPLAALAPRPTPTPGTYGGITRAEFTFWRNAPLTYQGVPFVFDRDCPKNAIYFVNPKTLRLWDLQ